MRPLCALTGKKGQQLTNLFNEKYQQAVKTLSREFKVKENNDRDDAEKSWRS